MKNKKESWILVLLLQQLLLVGGWKKPRGTLRSICQMTLTMSTSVVWCYKIQNSKCRGQRRNMGDLFIFVSCLRLNKELNSHAGNKDVFFRKEREKPNSKRISVQYKYDGIWIWEYHKTHSITACWILSVGKTYEFIIDYPNYNYRYKQINRCIQGGREGKREQWHQTSMRNAVSVHKTVWSLCSLLTCLSTKYWNSISEKLIWYPTYLQQEPGLCFLLWMNRKKLWLDGPAKAKVVDTSHKSRLGKDQGLCSVLKMWKVMWESEKGKTCLFCFFRLMIGEDL